MARGREAGNPNMIKGLVSEGPDPILKEQLMLVGRLVGDWEYDAEWYLPDGSTRIQKGEMHAGWILNGTAIQKSWSIEVETPPFGVSTISTGTSIYIYNPQTSAWREIWISPLGRNVQFFAVREAGADLVLEGPGPDGKTSERWILSEITADTFRWCLFVSHDSENTWELAYNIMARRVDAGA